MQIVVVLMVKNEENTIVPTLKPFVESGIKDYVIFDTGSEDKTVDVASEYLEGQNSWMVNSHFKDFARSRNDALQFAERTFPDSDFLLMIDAEWIAHGIPKLIELCQHLALRHEPLYMVKVCLPDIDFYSARLFRTISKNRYKGVVHEVPVVTTTVKVDENFYFTYNPEIAGRRKSQKRWQRDELLLKSDLRKYPNNSRSCFYLAQTYECLNDHENALKYYKKRKDLKGWDEEDFITTYRIALCYERLAVYHPEKYAWMQAMDYFLEAIQMRPTRIEPMIKIANHYWPKNIEVCFAFVSMAYHKPFPLDVLFLERTFYSYHRYEIMSKCAWHMQEYELGREATLEALKVMPKNDGLQKNLELYEEKLK